MRLFKCHIYLKVRWGFFPKNFSHPLPYMQSWWFHLLFQYGSSSAILLLIQFLCRHTSTFDLDQSFLSLLTPLCKLAKWSQSWSRNSILLGLYHDWKYPCDTSMRWQCRFWQLWQARRYLPSHQYKGNAFDHCHHQWAIKRTKPCLDSWWRGSVEHTRITRTLILWGLFLCYSIRNKLNFPHLLQCLTNFEH